MPFAAVYLAGVPAAAFTGDGVGRGAGLVGGSWHGAKLAGIFLVLGGMMSAFGCSTARDDYSRLRWRWRRMECCRKYLANALENAGAMVRLLCWRRAGALPGLGFERLVTLDIILYGGQLIWSL